MRTRVLLAVLLAAGFSAGASASAPPPVRAAQSAGLGIRLLDAPVDRKDDPRARTYIVDHLKPGTTIRRRVQLSDNTNGPLHASIYVGGARIDGGTFNPTDKGDPAELSDWSTAAPGSVDLHAGGTSDVQVTIAVPASASAGERYGVIWAELPASNGSGIKEVNRVGVRIYLSVGSGGEPASDFTVDSLQGSRRADGVALVLAQVHNTGGRALDMSGTLSLTNGPAGLSAGPFPATLGTSLKPGQTEPVTIVLGKAITGGPWTATLDVRSGVLRRKAQAQISFPDKAGTTAPPVAAKNLPLYKDKGILVPIAVSFIGLLFLILLVLALREYLRRQRAA
ncbi:MAG: hypothetical protein JWM40_1694 [Frankiales bacterium]|nr:hypothetical protein [Frankiales bacterium]